MKQPFDEYEDARKKAKALEREHANAKITGSYQGSTGSGSGPIKSLAKLIGWLLVLGFIAVVALIATGNEAALNSLLDSFR